jgi:hypothetical protein
MTVELEIAALTTQTTQLLDVVSQISASVNTQIAAAVLASVNASQIPLVNMATSLILTQAMLITHAGVTP